MAIVSTQLFPMSWEYIGGFFDGEGCIVIKPTNYNRGYDSVFNVWLQIYQNDLVILDDITEFVYIETQAIPYLGTNKKTCHFLQYAKMGDVENILSKLVPWLRVKREIAAEALEFISIMNRYRKEHGQKWRFHVPEADHPVIPLAVRERGVS